MYLTVVNVFMSVNVYYVSCCTAGKGLPLWRSSLPGVSYFPFDMWVTAAGKNYSAAMQKQQVRVSAEWALYTQFGDTFTDGVSI